MSGKRKLTDVQIDWAKMIIARRRELLRQISLLPTNAQIAEELECSRRWIESLSSKCRQNLQISGDGLPKSKRLFPRARRQADVKVSVAPLEKTLDGLPPTQSETDSYLESHVSTAVSRRT